MASIPSWLPHHSLVTHFTCLTMWKLFTSIFVAVESQLQPETAQIALMSLLATTAQNTQSVYMWERERNLLLPLVMDFIPCQETDGCFKKNEAKWTWRKKTPLCTNCHVIVSITRDLYRTMNTLYDINRIIHLNGLKKKHFQSSIQWHFR